MRRILSKFSVWYDKYFLYLVVAINVFASIGSFATGDPKMGVINLLVAAIFGLLIFMKHIIFTYDKEYKELQASHRELLDTSVSLLDSLEEQTRRFNKLAQHQEDKRRRR